MPHFQDNLLLYINRIKVEFKDAYQPLLLQGSYYINRIKVEFKVHNHSCIVTCHININRIKVEFKVFGWARFGNYF